MSAPLFSIVVPVYNREQVVERTLRSIEAQNWRPLHLVLVDNASTDGSLALLRRWARSRRTDDFRITIVEEKTPGAAAARNRGLREVDSEYMLFFDSDDEMLPGAVAGYMRAFLGPEEPDLVTSRCYCRALNGKVSPIAARSGDPLIAHIHHATLRTLGYAARTSLMRGVGAWNADIHIWDDWELGIRLLLASEKRVSIPTFSCLIHISPGSVTGDSYAHREPFYDTAIEAARADLAACARKDRNNLLALMDYKQMMLAAHFRREGHPELAERWRAKALEGKSFGRRLTLRLAYTYIRHGLRGFDRLLPFLP